MTSPQMVRLDEHLQRLRLNTVRERLEALLQEATNELNSLGLTAHFSDGYSPHLGAAPASETGTPLARQECYDGGARARAGAADVWWKATMSTGQMDQRPENVERRVDRIEQILSNLATREDLKRVIAPLATKTDLWEFEQRLHTHFDVVTGSLRDDIRLVAEAVVALSERVR